jgi:hypothetical protein
MAFFTHIRLMLQMMPPPLSLFFSSFSACYCSIAQRVMIGLSFFSALITAKRFLLSFSSALTFCKKRLAQKDT